MATLVIRQDNRVSLAMELLCTYSKYPKKFHLESDVAHSVHLFFFFFLIFFFLNKRAYNTGNCTETNYPVRWGLDLEQIALKLELFNSEL